jgi:rod shape-determining protein MreB
MARRWKENHSFVGKAEQPIIVEITVQGKPLQVDITSSIQKSCESIVADIVESVKQLICSFDPEFQADLKQNILLAGGGSLIRNLDHYLEEALAVLGKVVVQKVPNPIEAGARGALVLAMDLTDDYWRGL